MALISPCIRLPTDAVSVADPDEELFFLYTHLARRAQPDGSQAFRGLGSVDSRQDTLSVHLQFTPEPNHPPAPRNTKKHSRKPAVNSPAALEIELAQDTTGLRTRKGDTGSVLWRASIDFAQAILGQCHSKTPNGLLNPDLLSQAHILELGAGTGLLALAFSSLVRRYTATDIPALVPLIHKNVALNLPAIPSARNIAVEPLDWLALHTAPSSQQSRHLPPDAASVDLVLAVDCTYHPALLPALVCALCASGAPALVVAELRAPDVIREFLALWLAQPGWQVWSISDCHGVEDAILGLEYGVWVGVKAEQGERGL